jgi:hypothetical protein
MVSRKCGSEAYATPCILLERPGNVKGRLRVWHSSNTHSTPDRRCLNMYPRLLQFNVNPAWVLFRKIGGTALHRQRRGQTLAYPNRQQLHRRFSVNESFCQVEPRP